MATVDLMNEPPTLAEVKTLYASNYRDVPSCLDTLRADVERDAVSAVATVCIRNGEIDVRGMGDLDIYQTYALLAQGMRMLEPVVLDALKARAGER